MRVITRAEWGALPARSTTRLNDASVNLFVLHHTTGKFRGARTVRDIQKFHQGPTRKWADIGYNFLVAPDGAVYEGRGWGFRGAHARGHNHESIGVAYIGDGRLPMPVAAQKSVLALLAEAERRFGKLRTVGHRDVGQTACPGDAVYAWWSTVKVRVSVAPDPVVPDLRDGWRRHLARLRRGR